MATEFCPECHQPMPREVVSGVRLTTFKAKLFRFIETHPGQSSVDLAQRFYSDRGGEQHKAVRSILSHIYQINEALMNTPVRVRGGPWAGYRIERGSDGAQRRGMDRKD